MKNRVLCLIFAFCTSFCPPEQTKPTTTSLATLARAPTPIKMQSILTNTVDTSVQTNSIADAAASVLDRCKHCGFASLYCTLATATCCACVAIKSHDQTAMFQMLGNFICMTGIKLCFEESAEHCAKACPQSE